MSIDYDNNLTSGDFSQDIHTHGLRDPYTAEQHQIPPTPVYTTPTAAHCHRDERDAPLAARRGVLLNPAQAQSAG